jgi:thiamine kinase-like enzyme
MGDPIPTDCHRIEYGDSIALNGLPHHIQFHLETKLLPEDEGSSGPSDSRTLRIVHVTSLLSAQHEVYLVQLSPINPNYERAPSVVGSKISSSKGKMISNLMQVVESFEDNGMINVVQDALWNGNYHVVVRIWMGTSTWWNCHHSANEDISKREVFGYELAHHIFSTWMDQSSTKLRLPRILYYDSNDDDGGENSREQSPWAILEYVGPLSRLYGNADEDRPKGPSLVLDTTYIDSMIPMRMEYGYNEPHLRWGRLPLERCIEYATRVLDSFIVPLHLYFFCNLKPSLTRFTRRPNAMDTHITYQTMVQFYSAKYDEFVQPNVSKLCNPGPKEEFAIPTPEVNNLHLLFEASQKLKGAIDMLTYDTENIHPIPKLSPVLCHMDLQPQNLLFASTTERPTSTSTTSLPFLVSVLDWEEATYADPRFELLLLCRKVCANREQANVIWHVYSHRMQDQYHPASSRPSIELGPIEPWLKLEAVHSITTLLLECVAGGGRGKCAAKDTLPKAHSFNGEIYGKMQREFQRLCQMGWSFCDTSHWKVG